MRNPKFNALLEEIQKMHDDKNTDYSTLEDPLANLKECTKLGLDPSIGVLLRMQDKMMRIQNFYKKGELVNESVRDSLIDLAVYSLLAVVILDEQDKEWKDDVDEAFDRTIGGKGPVLKAGPVFQAWYKKEEPKNKYGVFEKKDSLKDKPDPLITCDCAEKSSTAPGGVTYSCPACSHQMKGSGYWKNGIFHEHGEIMPQDSQGC